jgi:hypothetical protein
MVSNLSVSFIGSSFAANLLTTSSLSEKAKLRFDRRAAGRE